ncbi:MAG TPA: hypothetical protein VGA95_03340 [Thermodesulfobacteriota bacterium]
MDFCEFLGSLVLSPEFIEGSKDCFFVPVLNHVLTIGQDLFSIKTKK